jgi:hypothetical protein
MVFLVRPVWPEEVVVGPSFCRVPPREAISIQTFDRRGIRVTVVEILDPLGYIK